MSMGPESPRDVLESISLTWDSIKTSELGKRHILLMGLSDSKRRQKERNQPANQSIFNDFQLNNSPFSSMKTVAMLFFKKRYSSFVGFVPI